jgi:4-hydroxybenzoate polyprenyltransferase
MITALLRLADSFFVMRPVVLIPVWGFALFGYYRGKSIALSDVSACWTHPDFVPFSLILIFSLSVACVYALNQIADIAADKKNGGLPLLASGVVSRAYGYIVAAVTALLTILIPVLTGHMTLAFLSIAAIIIGFLYSFKPTFFSGRPFLDFLTNAFGFGIIAFACGWYCSGNQPSDPRFFKAALPYFFLMCAGSISSTIPDMIGDRETGKTTTAVLFGARGAHVIALFCLCIASVDALVMKDPLALLCSGAALPVYLLYLFIPIKILEESTYKIGGLLCMIAAALFSPWFAVFSSATVLATWMYFRLRHHVSYPSLVPLKNDPSASA